VATFRIPLNVHITAAVKTLEHAVEWLMAVLLNARDLLTGCVLRATGNGRLPTVQSAVLTD
jgi:hypothetical protein